MCPIRTTGARTSFVPTPRGVEVTETAGAALHAAYIALEAELPLPLQEVEAILDVLNEALQAVVPAPD